MTEVLGVIVKLSALVFVVASMVAMGLSMTIPQIISPLKNIKLLILALVANFILVPALGYAIITVAPEIFSGFNEGNGIAVILLATAAGAPFLPKLTQAAHCNIAYSVGLMVLLMLVTIAFLPIALPLLLPGVAVDSWEIARSLIIAMLVPLGIGLFIKARYSRTAEGLQPVFGQASNTALMIMLGVILVMHFRTIIDTVGTGVILGGIILYVGSFVIGVLSAYSSEREIRNVLGLGTAQRNLSATFVVAAGNFLDDPDVIITLIVLSIVDLLILLPLAGEIGRRISAGLEPVAGGADETT